MRDKHLSRKENIGIEPRRGIAHRQITWGFRCQLLPFYDDGEGAESRTKPLYSSSNEASNPVHFVRVVFHMSGDYRAAEPADERLFPQGWPISWRAAHGANQAWARQTRLNLRCVYFRPLGHLWTSLPDDQG
ncbi:hypothetical protein RRG08_018397 [Elysia crispata]|uniref:Uncharacterized protein n=1 Tax=Elysia crispata TaxID=231223 RepID=A0AAE1AD93_9GAST|nr:hypothetical protein RRG08_018397 [Elysia crispata]